MRISDWSSDVCSSDLVGANAVDASAVRATYFLDPEGILRASTWYPLSVGRSVEEMLRLVAALQRVHDGTALAPEGWRPGDDLLAVPSQDIDDVLAAPDGTRTEERLVGTEGVMQCESRRVGAH